MSSTRVFRRVYSCVLAVAFLAGLPLPARAGDATIKVAFWNIMSGKGVDALAGHNAPFKNTANCTDPSQPLNAWGVGASQAALQSAVGSDPSVVALGLAESWASVCGSPEHVRQVLGWKAVSSEQNGVALVARYGFAGPEKWQQLDTTLNTSPGDTMWVLRVPVCVDAACSQSMPVYVGHWYGTGTNGPTSYEKQAQQTVSFLNSTSNGEPHVFVGDLNVWEGSAPVCNQNPTNTALPYLRAAGYYDAWLTVHGAAEGYSGMANRAGCGFPEGYAWKHIDYAWTQSSFQPLDIQRWAMVNPGDASPSDHYGIIVTLPNPFATATTTTPTTTPTTTTPTTTTPTTTTPTTTTPTTTTPTTTTPTTTTNGDIVLYAKSAKIVGSAWTLVTDATAAGGARVANADAGAAKLSAASAAPGSYIELPFTAEVGKAYRLWIRGKAQADSWQNDSTFVQFSGSVAADGSSTFRIGTTAATVVSIEEGSGAGVAGWGWQDNGYGIAVLGDPIYFNAASQTLRIQVREDGLSIDQIVLSPVKYFTAAPGAGKNDATILTETAATTTTTTPTTTTPTTTTPTTTTPTTTTPTTTTPTTTTPTTTTPTTTSPTTTSPTVTNVAWTSFANAAASGSTLQKNGGCSTCFDSGAISEQVLTGDGSLSFTVAAGQRLFVGLGSDRSASTGYATIDYAFSFWANGTWEVREKNTYRTEGTMAAGDVFKVAVEGGVVKYYRNGTLVYTSKVAIAGPLGADTSMSSTGSVVSGATLTAK